MPLLVELWDRDRQKSQNNLLGAAHLPLSHVLKVERTHAVVGYINGTPTIFFSLFTYNKYSLSNFVFIFFLYTYLVIFGVLCRSVHTTYATVLVEFWVRKS